MVDGYVRRSGTYGRYRGVEYEAVRLRDGTINLIRQSVTAPPGFVPSRDAPDLWHRHTAPVELDSLTKIAVWATWRDHKLFVLGVPTADTVYLSWDGRDADWADGALHMREPGIWQGNVSITDIDSVREDHQDLLPDAIRTFDQNHGASD